MDRIEHYVNLLWLIYYFSLVYNLIKTYKHYQIVHCICSYVSLFLRPFSIDYTITPYP